MAGGTWDKLEQVFEDRVARALSRLGVHTQSDVERLAAARRRAVGGGQRADQGTAGGAGARKSARARRSAPAQKRDRSARRGAPRDRRRKRAPADRGPLDAAALLAVQPLDLLDVVGHRVVGAHALELRPRVVLRAADEIESARAFAGDVALGRLLVVRIELEQRRVVRASSSSAWRPRPRPRIASSGRLSWALQPWSLRGSSVDRSSVHATLARTRTRAQRTRGARLRRHFRRSPCEQARKDFRGRYRVAADGSARQPDDDLRRADVRPAAVARALRRVIDERFLVFRRFRQRAVKTAAGMRTGATIATSTSTAHVVATKLPGPAGERELQALVSKLIATPLAARSADVAVPSRRPTIAAAAALIARIHHCYADGIALVRVMLSMTDASADGPPAMPFDAARATVAARPTIRSRELLGPLAGVREVGAEDRPHRCSRRAPASGSDPAQAVALAGQGRRADRRRSRSSR